MFSNVRRMIKFLLYIKIYMEGGNMENKIFMVVGIMLFLAFCGIGFYMLENYQDNYYTQIDNTKVKELSSSDDMKYEYNIDCYSKTGKKKKLKFKTSRLLKEDAYILLEVNTFGVHKWQEVKFSDMPQKVQEKLK